MVWHGFKNNNKNPSDVFFKNKNKVTCSTYDNHFKSNSQHNQDDLYDHLMSKRIFTLIMNQDTVTSRLSMQLEPAQFVRT